MKNVFYLSRGISFHSVLQCRWVKVIAFLALANGFSTLPAKAAPVAVKEVQQSTKVTGIVTNLKGEPVIGGNVMVKGTSTGTSTGVDGKFTLNVPTNKAVLVVSCIGYLTKEVPVGEQKQLSIQLEEKNASIDELVVVGYGTQRKATVTGSVASVTGKDMKQSASPNLSNSIVGRMPGVIANNRSGQPGNDYSEIYVRGKGTNSSTPGANSPLFVIDGVANRGGFERLNPSDIESLTILKDASAAIYGAQAANGVILVTTKRGTTSKPTITYDGSYGVSQNTRTPHLMNAYQYLDYTSNFDSSVNDLKNAYLNGTVNKKQYGDTDWMKVIFRDFTPQTQHSLSVRGGSENVKYFLSGGYLYQEPGFRNTNQNFSTTQFRANIDANITKDLTVNLELGQREEDRNQSDWTASDVMWEAYHAYPYLYDYYPNGLPGPGIEGGNNLALLNTGASGFVKIKDNFYNTKVGFNLKLPWIVDGLSVSGYGAVDMNFRRYKNFNDQWDAYEYDPETDSYNNIRSQTQGGKRWLKQESKESRSTTYHFRLAYEKRFGEHNISAFAAYEQNKAESDYINAYRENFLSGSVPYIFAGSDLNKNNDGKATISARQNYFGRASYALKDRYLAEFTLRYDGSQNFPKDTRWGLFPGVSVGWRISEESFVKDKISFINNLKLKASWGKLGNDIVPNFQYLSTFNLGAGAVLGGNPSRTQGFTPGVTANTSITWEEVDTKNLGFESSLFGNKLTFDIQYFYSMRTHILTKKQASIPLYTGITLPDQNIAKISNSGIEVDLMHRNKIGNIGYNVGGNFTFVRNNVHFMDEAVSTPEWQKRTGYSMDSWLVYKSDGIYQTEADIAATPHLNGSKPGDIKYLDVNGDGKISSDDKYRIHMGNIPEIVYGINMGASWKGFEVNTLWQGQARAKQMIRPVGFNIDVDYYNNRWISPTETPNAKYPRAFNTKADNINAIDSDFWLKDASFIRLKNVEVAYTLPARLVSNLKMTNVRVYVSGFNLITIDKIKLLDPEGTDSRGMYYPQQRIYSAGVSLSF